VRRFSSASTLAPTRTWSRLDEAGRRVIHPLHDRPRRVDQEPADPRAGDEEDALAHTPPTAGDGVLGGTIVVGPEDRLDARLFRLPKHLEARAAGMARVLGVGVEDGPKVVRPTIGGTVRLAPWMRIASSWTALRRAGASRSAGDYFGRGTRTSPAVTAFAAIRPRKRSPRGPRKEAMRSFASGSFQERSSG
jgi:hypothetical protein